MDGRAWSINPFTASERRVVNGLQGQGTLYSMYRWVTSDVTPPFSFADWFELEATPLLARVSPLLSCPRFLLPLLMLSLLPSAICAYSELMF